MPADRALLQQLAKLRLDEAKALAQQGQYSGAYYLAGYAIECALKARIAGQFRANEIPDKDLVNSIYSHKLAHLLSLSGLEAELDAARRSDSELDRRWSIVKNWTEQARYSLWTKDQADAIIDAIESDGTIGGIFQWLSARW